jgi:hypothetical protein
MGIQGRLDSENVMGLFPLHDALGYDAVKPEGKKPIVFTFHSNDEVIHGNIPELREEICAFF